MRLKSPLSGSKRSTFLAPQSILAMSLSTSAWRGQHLPFECLASPSGDTLTTTLLLPAKPSPTVQVIDFAEELVTTQLTPPMVTAFLALSLLNPVPVMSMDVPLFPGVGYITDYDHFTDKITRNIAVVSMWKQGQE